MQRGSRAVRAVSLGFAVLAVAGLAGCAAPVAEAAPVKAPTMAPEQSIGEACNLAQTVVDQLVLDTESRVREGLEEAGNQMLQGRMPSFDFLAPTLDGTLDSLQTSVTNAEVSAALGRIGDGLTGFGGIEQPGSILSVPAYLTSLHAQLGALSDAGAELRTLCGIG